MPREKRKTILARWLDPENEGLFLEQQLGQRVGFFPGKSERFADVLTVDEFLAALHKRACEADISVRFAGRSERENQRGFSQRFYDAARSKPCWSSLDNLSEDCFSGLTLAFNSLYKSVGKTEKVCRQMLQELGEYTGANAYFSPPRGQLGLGWHYDCWDVFVLQISGSKAWNICEENNSQPVEKVDFSAPEPEIDSGDVQRFQLSAGDMLYIPRGVWHRPVTGDEHSLHLTVGFHRRPHLHLNAWIWHELSQERGFREFLPLDPFMGGPNPELDDTLRAALTAYAERITALLTHPDSLKRYRIFCLQFANKRIGDRYQDIPGDNY